MALQDDQAPRPPTWRLFIGYEGHPRRQIEEFQNLRDAVLRIVDVEPPLGEQLTLQARVDLRSKYDLLTTIRLEYRGKSALYVIEMVD